MHGRPRGFSTPPSEPALTEPPSPLGEKTPLLIQKRRSAISATRLPPDTGPPALFQMRSATSATRLSRLLVIAQALACLLLPIVIFIGTGLAFTFQSMVSLALVAPLLCIAVLALALRKTSKVTPGAELARDLWWHAFLLATICAYWVLGIGLGSHNRASAGKYFDYVSMGTYMEVDPLLATGQLLQDAGRILFEPGARVDLSRAVGFKNTRLYCVAPVTMTNSTGAQAHDFWVVGVDCCSGGSGPSTNFRCGEIWNPRASSALRVLEEGDTRGYWRLAVQEAEAAFKIRAEHPLFLDWMQDPVHEVNSSWQNAKHALLVQCMTVATVQFLLVLAAVVALGKRPGSFGV